MSRRIARRPLLVAVGVGLPATALGLSAATEHAKPPPTIDRVREARLVLPAQPTRDGAGVKLRRALGSSALSMLDPFLLLDEMRSDRPEDYAAGFPTHPHRGFETVTYVIEGAVDHKDSLGNHGHLGAGSAQWMTAGHGIVHSEMPTHDTGSERLWGLQLWVNLPASQKMSRPRYQDVAPSRVPELRLDDANVRLVAGAVGNVRGPVEGIATAPEMLDVSLPAKGRFAHPVPESHNAFLYVLDGAAEIGASATPAQRGDLVVLGPGALAVVRSEPGTRFLLLAAQPIGEPVARSGPFVMNTDDELRQAWDDYRTGRLVQT
jgi:redox-sensitive bicupin YhaK (pirin superfamily)